VVGGPLCKGLMGWSSTYGLRTEPQGAASSCMGAIVTFLSRAPVELFYYCNTVEAVFPSPAEFFCVEKSVTVDGKTHKLNFIDAMMHIPTSRIFQLVVVFSNIKQLFH
jgi:hypothetical protein